MPPTNRKFSNSTKMAAFFLLALLWSSQSIASEPNEARILRVFIFAGQSNMVGSDSPVSEVNQYTPFTGYGEEQTKVKFAYAIGRENMKTSNGWTTLRPVNNVVGPELSFSKMLSSHIKDPIAIIKCASGGTTLGKDWNPEDPGGFKLYSTALSLVRDSLQELRKRNIKYSIEGFIWHQGENDMFNEEYRSNYASNLKKFIKKWRTDLNEPQLHFYIGELSCNTVWGMDNRENMYRISTAQKKVCHEVKNAQYIPTNHISIRTKSRNGLHYHYGTLGQLEHGENYATAYLRNHGHIKNEPRTFKKWPFKKHSPVKLFVLAGHRNMEGEISFTEDLSKTKHARLRRNNNDIAYQYSLGGGYRSCAEWEPMGPAGLYHTFGPELSFASNIKKKYNENIAVIKFTHSGSQMIDWTPEGSNSISRNLYPSFIDFITNKIDSLEKMGHKVELEGVFYHLSENDTSYAPYKSELASRMSGLVAQSRIDLGRGNLKWFVSQQPATEFEGSPTTDVHGALQEWDNASINNFHIQANGLIKDGEHILMNGEGVVKLGLLLSSAYLNQR